VERVCHIWTMWLHIINVDASFRRQK
jgi:hypothetical protein